MKKNGLIKVLGKIFSGIDLPMLFFISMLLTFSLIVLYSAGGQSIYVVKKQFFRIVLGFIVLIICAQVPARFYYRMAPILYTLGVTLLILVLAIGYTSKGAQRWLNLGFMRFQPAEIMKIVVPSMTAYYLSNKNLPPKFKQLAMALLITIIPGYLIAKQPDLGTSILVVGSGLIVIFFSGISYRLIGYAAISFAVLAPISWSLLHNYQKERILTLLNPESDPLGKGYHIIQSKIAIGSGGYLGKGWLQGTQSQLEFLPERTTDFIFAVLAEEFGLLGVTVLLSVYIIIILRGVYICKRMQTSFARLLAISLILTFLIYLFVNIGMVSGILPVVGIPLPLFSYGGTSLLTIMACFGIVFSLNKKY